MAPQTATANEGNIIRFGVDAFDRFMAGSLPQTGCSNNGENGMGI